MGSQLMSAFAAQLGGTYVVVSSAGSGSEVTLRFPISPANQDLPDEA
jgi:signal transduction histidine kinase